MRIKRERQLNPVSDEILALTAVVRPILTGVLYALKADVVAEVGGYDNVKLKLIPRLYRAGDGDCGICFEYAVHEAMNRGSVLERIEDATRLCNLPGTSPKSILFGLEKSGALQLIDTAGSILTDESRLRYSTRGQPAKLRRHWRRSLAHLEIERRGQLYRFLSEDCGRQICSLGFQIRIGG